MDFAETALWTPEQEARYRWLLHHIETCTVCEWRNEDDSSNLCPAAEQYFDTDGIPSVAGGAP